MSALPPTPQSERNRTLRHRKTASTASTVDLIVEDRRGSAKTFVTTGLDEFYSTGQEPVSNIDIEDLTKQLSNWTSKLKSKSQGTQLQTLSPHQILAGLSAVTVTTLSIVGYSATQSFMFKPWFLDTCVNFNLTGELHSFSDVRHFVKDLSLDNAICVCDVLWIPDLAVNLLPFAKLDIKVITFVSLPPSHLSSSYELRMVSYSMSYEPLKTMFTSVLREIEHQIPTLKPAPLITLRNPMDTMETQLPQRRCVKGGMTRSYSTTPMPRALRQLERIHIDFAGGIYILKSKDQAFDYYEHWVKFMTNLGYTHPAYIHKDIDGVLRSAKISNLMAAQGIQWESTTPIHLFRMCLDGCSTSNYSLRELGSEVYAHLRSSQKPADKLSARAEAHIFICFNGKSIYQLWNPRTDTLLITGDSLMTSLQNGYALQEAFAAFNPTPVTVSLPKSYMDAVSRLVPPGGWVYVESDRPNDPNADPDGILPKSLWVICGN
ncbi:hypothetical protein PAAG_04300 [Paracoccidioides lutzii Pb01]|uniref:Uncharacterized protein n=1 Tax=Paracoccidioides lutzii (strain ATCC MYA-826 / Pb01) TaxID=502779 RepID=C1H0K6_PARBA|nr:hypothetical protein PAAG_04300 [Paracoccidioides lutzii Pb01]EEH33247.1 hypothetical protein PAAG_04300 [Paracoccidioides lutzii Pb01]